MPRPDRLARALVDACFELHRRRSWVGLPGDAPFLIRVPPEADPLAGVLMGQGGMELGLVLSRGPDALGRMYRGLLREGPGGADLDKCDFLSVTFDRLGEIPGNLRAVLRAAGFQGRREKIAPSVFVRPSHRQARAPGKREMRTLLWCLRGVFAAEDRGELQPRPLQPGRKVLELELGGELARPDVTTRFVPWSAEEVPTRAIPALLPADLRGLPRLDKSWCAGLPSMPGRIEGDERTWNALLVAELGSGLILCVEVVPSGEPLEAIPTLVKTLRENGLPREIVFASKLLMDVLAPGLGALDVVATLDLEQPFVRELAAGLAEHLSYPDADPRATGSPTEIEEWKQAEHDFTDFLVKDLLQKNAVTSRAMKRYFGDEELGQRVIAELEGLNPMAAFTEWLAADYRPTRRSRTYFEKLLEKSRLDPLRRALIEARREALLSIYHVESTVPGESIELEDVLSGRRYTVQERAMSSCDIEGLFLPLRLLRVGEWLFLTSAGPPIPPLQIDEVLSRLESAGLSLGSEGLREDAHLVGRTWEWILEARQGLPQIQNTDGDPIEWHRAEFHVADPAAFVEALEQREDVHGDESGSEWTWFREGAPSPGLGEATVLGHFQLFDDSLLVEVNSARRFARVREWVEALPGVRFDSVSRIEQGDEELPLDDRLPGPPAEPLSPEIRSAMEKMMNEYSIRWLDEPIPALGNLTPRAACATKQGRRRVTRLIRTMPPMKIPGGKIAAPRERLLRELRLD